VQLQSNRAPHRIPSVPGDESEPQAQPAQGLAAAASVCSGANWALRFSAARSLAARARD
jgi:hypothetical protein